MLAADAATGLVANGWSGLQEIDPGTLGNRADTDRDGLNDGDEIANELNPLDGNDCPEELCPRPAGSLLKIITVLKQQEVN